MLVDEGTSEHGAGIFRRLVEHSEDVLWATNLQGQFLYCSPSVFQLRGFTAEEVVRQRLDEVLTPDSLAVALDRLAAIQGSGWMPRNSPMELEQRRKDGSTVWTEVIVSPMIEDGCMVGLCGITRDISARKEAERELRAAKETAERAMRARAEFLALMSHEVRTPLNGILGMAQLLLADGLNDDQRASVAAIQASGEMLKVVLDDVLDFSRLESGVLEVSSKVFDLGAHVATSVALMAAKAGANQVAIARTLAPGLPGHVTGDPARLRQVLLNLIGNAVKFTPRGSVHVAVARGDGGHVRFTVEDDGIGIDPQSCARLFEPFVQADDEVSRRFGGTGLGLAICKRIIDHLGGRIGIEPRAEGGTRAWFEVPLPAADPPAPEEPMPEGAAPLSILLVEDNAFNRTVATRLLSRMGHRVTTAEDGAQAVDAAKARDFDLILMDVRMPGMDGLAATRAIRALAGPRGRVPIVAMTANAFPEDRQACLAAGMDDHLPKPIQMNALASALVRLTR